MHRSLIAALLAFPFLLCGQQPSSPLLLAHAHNDYEHKRPLADALEQQFHSVEADVWLVDGKIMVAHNRGDWRGTLQQLYLDPLQERVANKGSVHGDGLPFLLWIDIKPEGTTILPVLHKLLSRYRMLTSFAGDRTTAGAVTVVLTGDAQGKTAYVRDYPTRYACRDDNRFRAEDPPGDSAWQWYALKWSSYVRWDGQGAMPPAQEQALRRIVDSIHTKGRRVRFYATPETEAYWGKAKELGIDLINTDQLRQLHDFLLPPR